MNSIIKLYSENPSELSTFLTLFFDKSVKFDGSSWKKTYNNPVEMSDIVASFIDNKNKFPHTNMWISIDKGVFINITANNYNSFIQYLYERYPY